MGLSMVSVRHTTRVHGLEGTASGRWGHGGLSKRGHGGLGQRGHLVSAMVVSAMVVSVTVVSAMVLGHVVYTRALSVSCAMRLLQKAFSVDPGRSRQHVLITRGSQNSGETRAQGSTEPSGQPKRESCSP